VAALDTLSPIESTLATPLWWRAQMSRDPALAFSDPVAEALVAELGLEPTPLAGEAWMTDVLTRRVQIIDDLVRDLLSAEPATVCVNVGAGLCTRKYRMPEPRDPWVDLDSPPVIALRRRLLSDRPPRSRFIAGSLEEDWLRYLRWSPGEPILFVAEGVLAYVAERDVRLFLERIGEACPGAHVLFDTCAPGFAERVNDFNKANGSAVRYRWAPREPSIVRTWHRHLLVSSVQTMGPGTAVVHVRARK
jgi:methyltransferase (TIGR00027 family)